jgi:hypothetical protein
MTTVSLSKLDLSFLKKADPAKVTTGSWRWSSKAQKFVTPQEWHKLHPPSKKRSKLAVPYFMPDVDAAYGGSWKSIIDDTEISSRSNWREHNKRNGVLQVDRDHWGKTEDHHVSQVRDRMEIGAPIAETDSVFSWKAPESAKGQKNERPSGKRRARKAG